MPPSRRPGPLALRIDDAGDRAVLLAAANRADVRPSTYIKSRAIAAAEAELGERAVRALRELASLGK